MRSPTVEDAVRLTNALLAGVQSHIKYESDKTVIVPTQAEILLQAMLDMNIVIDDGA